MVHNFKSRAGAVVAGAAVLAAVGGVGGAAAAGQIGSLQIRDHSIASKDMRWGSVQSRQILNGSVNKWDLSKSLQAVLGVPGPAGAKGDTGAAGAKGDTGATGATGADGARGPKGDAGKDGVDGTNGLDGTNGTNGLDGTNGTDGVDGKNGASAYDVAVADGFTGTEAEWLDSLKGKDGAAGAPGKDGVDGAPGKDGVDGAPGKDGVDGTNGTNGTNGVSGYHQATNTVTVTANGRQTVSSTCNTGEVVLGGGVSGGGNVTVLSSYPSAAGTWSGTVQKTPGAGNVTVDVYAVCATAN